MIGVGFLTLPEIGRRSGLIPMIFFILGTASISVFANWQLGRGFRATGAQTYGKIISSVDGKRSAVLILIFLFIYVYVSAGAFYVFGAKFAMSCIDHWSLRPEFLLDDNRFADFFITIMFVICFLGSLPSKMTSLNSFTLITAVINLGLGVLLLAQVPDLRDYYRNRLDQPQAEYPQFNLDKTIFSSYCLALFTSINQFSAVNVLSEYKNPTPERVNRLVFLSPIIPIIVYLMVGIAGFLTCGDQCNEIIINRLHRPGTTDYLMDVSKVLLLICLAVGIIIRNHTNKVNILAILSEDAQSNNYRESLLIDDIISKDNDIDQMKDTSIMSNDTTELVPDNTVPVEKIQEFPFLKVVFIHLINSLIPPITAILVKDSLMNYLAAGTGFVAPVFVIIYPCLITIRLHERGVMQISRRMYISVWIYMVVVGAASYVALLLSTLVKFKVL